MQGSAAIDNDAIEDRLEPGCPFEQGAVGADIGRSGRRHADLLVQSALIDFQPLLAQAFKAGRAVAIKGRAAERRVTEIVKHRELQGIDRIDVRQSLGKVQAVGRRGR